MRGHVDLQGKLERSTTQFQAVATRHDGRSIRRLTPVECERLQGFTDGWTAIGTEGPISGTQRYKMCGNAVTVNVVREVVKRLA